MITTNRQQHEEAFGIIHAFTLGTILFIGAIASLFLYTMNVVPTVVNLNQPVVDLALWVVEIVLYLGLGYLFSRKPVGALLGLALGLVTRLFATLLIFLLVQIPLTKMFAFGPESTMGFLHLLAVIITLVALLLSFRNLLIQFGVRPVSPVAATRSKVHFSFDNAATTPKPPASGMRVPLVLPTEHDGVNADGEPASHLRPPADFSPVYPKDDISGSVSIPASVILESVPEAKLILAAGYGIPVRLAYFVPQLPQATAWLTWKQVFEKGVPPMPHVETAKLEPEFYSRWIRIPARVYALQVPREYYQVKKLPPTWMRLPEVEQEADITFKA